MGTRDFRGAGLRLMPRQHAAQAYGGLKAGTRLLTRDLGGIDAAAACSRVGRSLISDYANPASDRFIPVDVVIDAEAIAGTPHVTAAMARALGYELVPLLARPRGELGEALARISTGVGSLFATVASAFADGALSEQERDALARDLDAVARLAAEARCLLAAAGPMQEEGQTDE